MADEYVSVAADDFFTHAAQAYGVVKNDPSQRREIATLIVEFLKAERVHVDFASPTPEPEIHTVALPEDDIDTTEEVSA